MITVNGRDPKEKLIEDLLSTIKKSNEITTEQNSKLSKYTKWLFWLTMAIVALTVVMVVLMILQYSSSSVIPPKQQSTAALYPAHGITD